VLIAVAVILLVLAVVGGIALHSLLFLLAIHMRGKESTGRRGSSHQFVGEDLK